MCMRENLLLLRLGLFFRSKRLGLLDVEDIRCMTECFNSITFSLIDKRVNKKVADMKNKIKHVQ